MRKWPDFRAMELNETGTTLAPIGFLGNEAWFWDDTNNVFVVVVINPGSY